MKKDGRYTCEPFEFAIASLDEVFVFHLGIVNLQDTFARGLLSRGLSVRTTAALFGIHFTTIQNWKKHPEKAKTPQKRPPKKIRTEELLVDIEMYPTDYLRTCSLSQPLL